MQSVRSWCTATGDAVRSWCSATRDAERRCFRPSAWLLALDAWIPVPFDLVSVRGYSSRVFAVLSFGGLSLRSYCLVITAAAGAALPRCEPPAELDSASAPVLSGGSQESGQQSLSAALPLLFVLGLANSRWHGRFWRVLALPIAISLYADSSTELRWCGHGRRQLTVPQLFAWLFTGLNTALLFGMLLRLATLLFTDPPAAAALVSPQSHNCVVRAFSRVVAGCKEWVRSELPLRADAPQPRAQATPRLPVRIVVALALSTCIVSLACIAQICSALLLQRHGPQLLALVLEDISHARLALRALLSMGRLRALHLPEPERVVDNAASLDRVLAYLHELLAGVGPPSIASAPVALIVGAAIATANELAWKVHMLRRAYRKCALLVPDPDAALRPAAATPETEAASTAVASVRAREPRGRLRADLHKLGTSGFWLGMDGPGQPGQPQAAAWGRRLSLRPSLPPPLSARTSGPQPRAQPSLREQQRQAHEAAAPAAAALGQPAGAAVDGSKGTQSQATVALPIAEVAAAPLRSRAAPPALLAHESRAGSEPHFAALPRWPASSSTDLDLQQFPPPSPTRRAPADAGRALDAAAHADADSREALLAEMQNASCYFAFYLIPISAANTLTAFCAVSLAASLLVFSLICAPAREQLWLSWFTWSVFSAIVIDPLLRRVLFTGVVATRHRVIMARAFRTADFVYSFSLGPLFGATLVLLRCLLGLLFALSSLARTDVSLLPGPASGLDAAYTAWQATLKLHAASRDEDKPHPVEAAPAADDSERREPPAAAASAHACLESGSSRAALPPQQRPSATHAASPRPGAVRRILAATAAGLKPSGYHRGPAVMPLSCGRRSGPLL